jgi:glycosyltransferase involved in cell wall biosynthesis
MKKKILVLAESLKINETSSGIVSSTLIAKLIYLGYEITVIYPKKFDYPITWLNGCELIEFEVGSISRKWYDGIPKFRALPVYFNFGYSREFKLLINEWKKEIQKVIKNKKFDVILVLGSGSEFSPHFAISELAIFTPFYVNIHDPFPFHNYPYPYQKKKTLLSLLIEFRFKKVLKKSKGVIFPSQKLREHMSSIFPEIKGKSHIIPHVSHNLINLPDGESDSDVNLNAAFINLLHAGSLLGPRNPTYLLNAIYNLELTEPNLIKNVRFVFIGKLAKEHKNLVLKSKCVEIIDKRVSYKKSLSLIEQANGVFVIEAISDFSPFMPGKLADIFLKQKPIIPFCPINSEVLSILGETSYHALLNDEEMITEVLKKFLNDLKEGNIENKSLQYLTYTSDNIESFVNKTFEF